MKEGGERASEKEKRGGGGREIERELEGRREK